MTLLHSTDEYDVEVIKRGKRTIGAFVRWNSGPIALFLYHSHKQIYRGEHKTISDACQVGTASWGVGVDLLLEASKRGAQYVGVVVRDTRDVYLAGIEDFYARNKSRIISKEGSTLPPKRHLALQHFRHVEGVLRHKQYNQR